MTRAPHRDFKFNCWVLKPSLFHFSVLKSLHYFFLDFLGAHLTTKQSWVKSQKWFEGPSMSKLYVHVTGHDQQKRVLGVPVRHNASQNKSLQNAFPIFECQMERRYEIQCTPFYYKHWCTGPFFPWIRHETGDGTKHVFTLLGVEMVRGMQKLIKLFCENRKWLSKCRRQKPWYCVVLRWSMTVSACHRGGPRNFVKLISCPIVN